MKLLLDIDGVIAPDLPATHFIDGYDVHIPEYMPALLKGLHDNFELIWCSMWEEDSNKLGKILGLSELPFVPLTGFLNTMGPTFKLPAIQKWDTGEPFIWVDDEICDEDYDWADERGISILKIDPFIGLTKSNVNFLMDIIHCPGYHNLRIT